MELPSGEVFLAHHNMAEGITWREPVTVLAQVSLPLTEPLNDIMEVPAS